MPNNQKNQTNQAPQKQQTQQGNNPAGQNAPGRHQDPGASDQQGGGRGAGKMDGDQGEPRKGQATDIDTDTGDNSKVNSNR